MRVRCNTVWLLTRCVRDRALPITRRVDPTSVVMVPYAGGGGGVSVDEGVSRACCASPGRLGISSIPDCAAELRPRERPAATARNSRLQPSADLVDFGGRSGIAGKVDFRERILQVARTDA